MEKMVLSASTDFIYDKHKEDCKLLADVPLVGEPTLELAEFLCDGEDFVTGEDMLFRAVEMGSLAGLRHAERMLALASEIPESWREFELIFPGTVWQDASGERGVTCLEWYRGKWGLRQFRLDHGWGGRDRLIRVSQP